MGMSILTFIAGVILTAILMSFTTISKINEYEEIIGKLKEILKQFEKMSKEQQLGSIVNMQNKIKSILQTAKSI